MQNLGWIKIHRKIQENAISKSPEHFALWIHLLLLANHEKSEFIFNGKKTILERGQFITGRKKLSEISGLHRSKVERVLKYLISEHQIEQQTNNKFRLITIINYNDYQENEHQIEQPVSNKRATSEQPVSTNKNDKNNKNEKNEILLDSSIAAQPPTKERIFYEAFKASCLKRGLKIDLSESRYIAMKIEYETKLMWWPEVQRCLAWLFDNHKKNVNANRLRNWMTNCLKFNKEKEIKARQEFQDKKIR